MDVLFQSAICAKISLVLVLHSQIHINIKLHQYCIHICLALDLYFLIVCFCISPRPQST